MKLKIIRSGAVHWIALALCFCHNAQAQITLQDGSTTSLVDDNNSNSVSQNLTVTTGASVLVVSVYDQNNAASDSGPSSLAWGSQTLTKAGGQYINRTPYRSEDMYYLINPTPGTQTITATNTSGNTPTAMAIQAYTLNGVNTAAAPAYYNVNGGYVDGGTPAYSLYVTLSADTSAGAWAVLDCDQGYNATTMSVTLTSGTPSYGQMNNPNVPDFDGNDVLMGGVANLAAGASTITGIDPVLGESLEVGALVFTSSGVNHNIVTPQFSGLAGSTVVTYGTTSVTLSGTVSTNGNYLPSGTAVTVTIDGDAQPTAISDGTGDFSINDNTIGLPPSATPYPVTYTSAAAYNFLAATNTSSTLTMNPLPVVLSGYLLANGTATAPAANLTVSNLVGSDNLTLSGSVSLAATNVGQEAITSFSGLTLGGTSAANYTLTGASGTVTVIGASTAVSPGLTNWVGVFKSAADLNGWAPAGGNTACSLSFLAGDAPPWGPSTGALVVQVLAPSESSGGLWTQFAKNLNGTNLTRYTQLDFDAKVGTNQNVWDQYGNACNSLDPVITYGSGPTQQGSIQPPIAPSAGNNGWQHFVVPAADFGPTSNLSQVQQTMFVLVDGYFPTTANVVLEFANVEWDTPPSAPNPTITINPGNVVRIADTRWLGLNTTVYCPDFNMQDGLPETRKAGWTTLRFPGGSIADIYHWYIPNDVIGLNNYANFATVATNLGATVMITANYGTGTPAEAAAWVADANLTNHYGFKYWEIGNEVYAYPSEVDSNTPGHDPYEYGTRAATYLTQMKAVDPTIKVGVVVMPGEQIDPGTNTPHYATNLVTGQVLSGWTPVVMSQLRQAGVTPDFAIYHCYPENGTENDQTLLATANWTGDAAELRGDMDDFLGPAGTNVELLVTENNCEAGTPGRQTVSLVNALYYCDSLGQMAQTEFNARIWWDLTDAGPTLGGDLSPNLYGWRDYGDIGAMMPGIAEPLTNRYPAYFAAELTSHFIGGGDKVVGVSSDLPLVSAYGAWRTNGNLTLMLINKSPTNYYAANLVLTNCVPGATATVYSYGMPQDNAAKNADNACDIATNTCNVSANFEYTLAPYSVNVLVFNLVPAAPSLSVLPPTGPGQFALQLAGQTNVPYVLQSSPDLFHWTSVATDTLAGTVLDVTNLIAPGTGQQFWRALWSP